jgi:hypothetical protein
MCDKNYNQKKKKKKKPNKQTNNNKKKRWYDAWDIKYLKGWCRNRDCGQSKATNCGV